MPASMFLKVLGLLTALAIISTSVLWAPEAPPDGLYPTTIKLAAGALMISGSFLLSCAISATFLRGSGRGAFRALYWASLASSGAGLAEAASGLIAVNVSLAVAMAALSYSGAGLMLLYYSGGG